MELRWSLALSDEPKLVLMFVHRLTTVDPKPELLFVHPLRNMHDVS